METINLYYHIFPNGTKRVYGDNGNMWDCWGCKDKNIESFLSQKLSKKVKLINKK